MFGGKDLEEKWFILVKMTPKHNLHKQLYIRFSQFVIIFQILKIYKNVIINIFMIDFRFQM